jgi:hypothetical protein
MDGLGMTEGDRIKIGLNGPAIITAVDYDNNTITIDKSRGWNDGDPVNMDYEGSAPDIGAYEYRAEENYDYSVILTDPVNASTIGGIVTVTAQVGNPDMVRQVVFQVNSLPIATVTQAPFTFDWNTTELPDGIYRLEARAYARFAGSVLWKTHEIAVAVGDVPDPLSPAGLVVTGVSARSVSLDWNSSTGAFGYRVYRNGQSVFEPIASQYTDNGLASDKEYNYTVTALGSGGYESAQSSGVTVTTLRSGGGGSSGDSGGGGGGGGCFIATIQSLNFWFMASGLALGWLIWTVRRAKSIARRAKG